MPEEIFEFSPLTERELREMIQQFFGEKEAVELTPNTTEGALT